MSDLQCPVRVLLVCVEANQGPATDDELRLADCVRAERVARVITDLPAAASSAELRELLEGLADIYRGETVLIQGPPPLLRGVLAAVGARSTLPETGDASRSCELVGDSDGWRRIDPLR